MASSGKDEISFMTEEVMRDISQKQVSFNRAFSWAARRRGIFHAEHRDKYNYLFRQVHQRFKRRDRAALKKSLRGIREWQHGNIIRDHPPAKGRFCKSDPWETADPANSFFPDNRGFSHASEYYLPEAPC